MQIWKMHIGNLMAQGLEYGGSLVLKVVSSILHLGRFSNRLIVLISLILDTLILP